MFWDLLICDVNNKHCLVGMVMYPWLCSEYITVEGAAIRCYPSDQTQLLNANAVAVLLRQLLVEMDGMATKEGVVILASTNRSDILDKVCVLYGC